MATLADLVLSICSISPDVIARVEPATRSRQLAERNLQANRSALEEIWPQALRLVPDELPMAEFLMARDGALTARFDDGQWFGGCSVPKRAAERSLARFEMISNAATLLAPQHPQVIALALEKMRSDQALIAIIPQDDTYAFTLALHDFSEAIRARRLWFAAGLDWKRPLVELLDRQIGLPPPTQLIRIGSTTSWLSDRIQQLADSIIARSARSQADAIARLANRKRAPSRQINRLCVIGSSRFNLWSDAHHWLHTRIDQIRSEFEVESIDLADPVRRSNHFVARTIDVCDAVLSAEIGRSDQPGIASMDVPWMTLCTLRAPLFSGASAGDRLMVCSDDLLNIALQNGWPRERIDRAEPIHLARSREGGRVALIANLDEPRQPAVIEAYSSHQALWQMLANLLGDPSFVPKQSPVRLITEFATKFGIDLQQLPIDLFLSRLVTPVWMLSVARRLKDQKIDFVIHGSGWESQADLCDAWQGPVESAEDFSLAISGAGRLLDVWPSQAIHPARSVGVDVVPTWGDPIRLLRSSSLITKHRANTSRSLSIEDVTRMVRDVPRMIRT